MKCVLYKIPYCFQGHFVSKLTTSRRFHESAESHFRKIKREQKTRKFIKPELPNKALFALYTFLKSPTGVELCAMYYWWRGDMQRAW